MGQPVLAADGVTFAYGRSAPTLRDVHLAVAPGESLGLVGESGAGKTTLLRLLLGLASPTSGTVRFEGRELDRRDPRLMRSFRRAVQPVYQDPFSSLDPRMRIGDSIAEPLRSLGARASRRDDGGGEHGDAPARRGPRSEHAARVAELLEAVGLPADAAEGYPENFSGGQRQRIAIARALAPDPRVILADEPVSALDTSVRVHIIELFQRLARERGIGMVLVSHDLTIVSALCRSIAVLAGGRIVEQGETARVLVDPRHAYTQRLLDAVPRLPGA
jgi:ABC-type glutathione transport system ATPase component